MYRLKEIKIRENLSDEEVVTKALKKYAIPKDIVKSWRIFRKSVDARNKNDVHFVYTIDVDFVDDVLMSSFTNDGNNDTRNNRSVAQCAQYDKLLKKRYILKGRRNSFTRNNS